MYKIQTLNNISMAGLDKLPRETYEVASEIANPDAILLRSYKMHDFPIPESLVAVGRAGTGVNNIPIDKMSDKGIVVFNAPGANANAVKELVLSGMMLACRHIIRAVNFADNLSGSDEEITKQVEAGKKNFSGFELPGKTIGVVGLGAIGRAVAHMAEGLGMKVVGYDPGLTVDGAWQLSSSVKKAHTFDEMLAEVDFLTFHVPLIDLTKNMLNAERIRLLKSTAVILNFARGGIVDDDAIVQAIENKKIQAYVCDFPCNQFKNIDGIIALPHLGASTSDAEDNCAIMVAENIKDYIENGNIQFSVNFPDVQMPRRGVSRLAIANKNETNMIGQISSVLAEAKLNIVDMINKSKKDLAYSLFDLDGQVSDALVNAIRKIPGVLSIRVLS